MTHSSHWNDPAFTDATALLSSSTAWSIPEFTLWRGIHACKYHGGEGCELQLLTAPVRASDSASVAWTSAPIERLLFVGTQWPVALACPTMPAAGHGTVPNAQCNYHARRRMAEDATVGNRRPHRHSYSGPMTTATRVRVRTQLIGRGGMPQRTAVVLNSCSCDNARSRPTHRTNEIDEKHRKNCCFRGLPTGGSWGGGQPSSRRMTATTVT